MQPELIVIDSSIKLLDLINYLKRFDFIAYDCETTGLTDKHQVIGVSVCAEESKAYYVIRDNYADNLMQELIETLKDKNLIMHNGIFDCMMAESNFKVRLIDRLHTDTMVLAHLLNENRRVGLKELAAAMYGEDSTQEQKEMQASVLANGGKWMAHEKEMWKADPYILGKYGAKDAWLTYKLFIDLVTQLEEEGLVKFFYEDESMPLLRGPTYDLNTTGLQVDLKELQKLKATLIAECAEAKSFVYAEIAPRIKDKYPGTNKKNTFNIGSSSQLSWLLFGVYGQEFGTLTKEGKTVCKAMGLRLPYSLGAKRQFIAACEIRKGEVYQPEAKINGKIRRAKKIKDPWSYIACDKEIIKKLAPKFKWVQKLHEYQKGMKLLSTYVEGIEERVQYGVIRPSYLQHGTITGRYASRNPNLQNLPRDDKRVKQCFVARSGKSLISADFSQLEPRIFAYYSGDERLMAAFDGTSDFYSVVGVEVYDKHDVTPQKEGSDNAFGVKYKGLRDRSKAFALAYAYGGTPHRIASITGRTVEESTEDQIKYFERFPGVKKMMLDAHTLVKSNGYVTNLFGRKRRIPDAKKINKLYGNISHAELPYDARGLLNQACNFRVQSTGASIVNRSAIRFYELCKEAGLRCKFVSQIHDELVVEGDEQDAENIAVLLQEAMENTIKLDGVALEAIPRITKTLAK